MKGASTLVVSRPPVARSSLLSLAMKYLFYWIVISYSVVQSTERFFETWRAAVLVTTLFLMDCSSPIILDLHRWQPTVWRRCKSLPAVTLSGVTEGLCLSEKSAFPNVERKGRINFCIAQQSFRFTQEEFNTSHVTQVLSHHQVRLKNVQVLA